MELVLTDRIPESVLPYPEAFLDQMKFIAWKIFISPFFMTAQEFLLSIGVLRHEGRQNYVLGKLIEGKNVDAFLKYLNGKDFKNHFIAWEDDGQLVSLRRLEGFHRQYHLRIFADGEIRGHYEYTPEAHPIWHIREVDMENRKDEFLSVLGDWVEPAQ